MKTTISLRVEVEEKEKWEVKAGGRTLTEWIREQCNLTREGKVLEAPSPKEAGGESNRVSEVRGDVKVPAAERREPDAGGPLGRDKCSHRGHGKKSHRGPMATCIFGDCKCGGFR
jgi:hypothetical protein